MSENKAIQLNAEDLDGQGNFPCPNPKAAIQQWNGHPKVYLSAKPGKVVSCPYCGTPYALAAGVKTGGH